jgi:quercetin dioxygenase-like cupin family protein
MTMSKNVWKLTWVGVLAVFALGGLALGRAWATAGQGVTTAIVSGPTLLDEVSIHSVTDTQAVKIKTHGFSDVYTVVNRIAPGGHTGWHSHPGPSIISVVSGQATEYDGDDPTRTPRVHSAGSSFVDDGQHPHMVRNEGSTELVLVAFQVLPTGAPRRIDEPKPEHYPF